MVQRDFQREGWAILVATAGQEWRWDNQRLLCRHFWLLWYTSNSFFGVSQRNGYQPGEAYERTRRMNALYSLERDSLERPHDAEAMERSAVNPGKNFVRRDWKWEPKERVHSKVTPRNLGVRLNVRGCQSEWVGVDTKLDGVCTEEATFTFSRVNWEAPFPGPFFKVIEGL